MTAAQETGLTQAMQALLTGAPFPSFTPEALSRVHAWRVVRWEADLPLTEEEQSALLAAAHTVMAPAGLCAARFDGDVMTVLVGLTRFPARIHRKTVMWLCGHGLTEHASIALEQEGTMFIGHEFDDPTAWEAHLSPMAEISDWWSRSSPLDSAAARAHRTQLQALIKRGQYTALGGYVSRVLRNESEPGVACFGFVPMIIQAVWSVHAHISLRQLTEGLSLTEMARRPRESLLAWLGAVQTCLRDQPAEANTEPIERVIAGIRADCSLPYSQANLSRSLGLTPAYFCRLFREKTGQHFTSFLTRTRMEHAQELLAAPGEHVLQEISQACGYPNKSYFSQVFRKYTGLTPGEYEQHCRQMRRR